MKRQKKGRVDCLNAAPTTTSNFSDNSAESQRQRLLEALQSGPMTTLQVRSQLDILAPAPRIFELRHRFKKNITTVRVQQATDAGQMHNVAMYCLMPDAQHDLFDVEDALQ